MHGICFTLMCGLGKDFIKKGVEMSALDAFLIGGFVLLIVLIVVRKKTR